MGANKERKALIEREIVVIDLNKSHLSLVLSKALLRRVRVFVWQIPILRIPFKLEGEAFEPEIKVRHEAPQSNVIRAGDWLTLFNRGGADVPKALRKPITHLEKWKGSLFYIENKVIPSDYLELLLEENKLDKKSFKDKIPLQPQTNPLYAQISTYPCIIQTFPYPVLYLAILKTLWKYSPKSPVSYHHGQGIDGKFNFLPEGGLDENRGSLPAKSVNNKTSIIDVEPLSTMFPSNVAENIIDSKNTSSEKDDLPQVGPSVSLYHEVV
nr:hypothetical protein [Tanacetum cinerariifolium]